MVLYGHNKPLSASEFFRKVSVEKRNLKMWNILHENRTTQFINKDQRNKMGLLLRSLGKRVAFCFHRFFQFRNSGGTNAISFNRSFILCPGGELINAFDAGSLQSSS